MIALPTECTHADRKKNGRNRNGSQRWRCLDCGKSFSDAHVPAGPLGTMEADPDRVFLAIQLLTEGMGVNATCRVVSLDKKTLLKAILVTGEKCQTFLDANMKNVSVNMVSIDEQW